MTRKLTIFDIDFTLFKTKALIQVLNNGIVTRELDSQQYVSDTLAPDETYSFTQFTDARLFLDTSEPMWPMIDRLNSTLDMTSIWPQDRVILATARSKMDSDLTFSKAFERVGIPISQLDVLYCGERKIRPTSLCKATCIADELNVTHYDLVHLYDDAPDNLRAFLNLQSQYHTTLFFATLVKEDGSVQSFH